MKKDDQISFASNRQNVLKLKIVMVGDQNVGKSSIIIRYVKNDFDRTNNPTIGIDFTSKNVTIKGRSVRLQLWDTAGQERFRSLIPSYLKDCNLAIIVYDVTNESALDNLQKWIDFVKQARGSDAHVCIVANKIDMIQEIKQQVRQKAKRIADELNLPYFQVSALSGKNVPEMFQQFAENILKSTPLQPQPIPDQKNKNPVLPAQKNKPVQNVSLNVNAIQQPQARGGICC